MALDGVVISSVVSQLKSTLLGGRIYKIYQPENDELILVIKNQKETYRLLLSAGASLPLVYLTEETKGNPMSAPNFCMLLRKHLNNGRIVSIEQPNFERIINISIEHLNELGDLCTKQLIIEVMGKHSNIIFVDEKNMIIDSIKHISAQISSVREVLPGRDYIIPPSHDKISPLFVTPEYFETVVLQKPLSLTKAIYTSFIGISPLIAEEICYRAGLDSSLSTAALSGDDKLSLFTSFTTIMGLVQREEFTPNIVFKGDKEPVEFSSIPLTMYSDYKEEIYPSISNVLENYYAFKNKITRIRQKSADLRKIVSNAIERTSKKYDLQLRQLKDTDKRDKYRIYGELINAYGYGLEPDASSLTCLNYYTNEEITIPLDPTLSPQENSKKYFAKYNKLKRTYEALSELIVETKSELEHLESISNSLDIALLENDLVELKQELMEYGYMKKRYMGKKKEKITSKPFHYISSDGFHIYVGKNNYQNEELTFKFANGGDWWFHAKGMAGSHVIIKREQGQEIPDRTFEEAGRLAGYYSKGRAAKKVEIDYTERKNLKKPPAAKPGFVIYHTNYSLLIEPDISMLTLVE